jgi:hypothetical protein
MRRARPLVSALCIAAVRVIPTVSILASCFLIGPAGAQCIDYRDYIHTMGIVSTTDDHLDVALLGHYAFLAGMHGMFTVIDVQDPENPQLVTSIPIAGRGNGVAVSRATAYVAEGGASASSCLQVIDVRNPRDPRIMGTVDLPDYGNDVFVSGRRAYVANNDFFTVVDVADPREPRIVGLLDIPGTAAAVDLAGSYAYVAAKDATYPFTECGLYAIDVIDPESPQLVGYLHTANAYDVTVSGAYAYLGCGASFVVVDITDPRNLQLVSQTEVRADAVAVSGQRAYLADTIAPLQVVDISDPLNPRLLATAGDWGFGVAVAENHAFLAMSHAFQVIDVENPQEAPIISAVQLPGVAMGVALTPTHAYIADAFSLEVVDVRDIKNPERVGSLTMGLHHARAVATAGRSAFVGRDDEVAMIDISDPKYPQYVSGEWIPEGVGEVTVASPYVYAAAGEAGLVILEFTASSLRIVGAVSTPGEAIDVAVHGDYAYVADYTAGMQVIDVSLPSSPRIVASVATGTARGVAVLDPYVYVAGDGLNVIDVADPEDPQIVGYAPIASGDVALSGTIAYVADPGGSYYRDGGVQVVDITDPKHPMPFAFSTVPIGNTAGVTVAGPLLFVAAGVGGLRVLHGQCGSAAAVGGNGRADVGFDSRSSAGPNVICGETPIRLETAGSGPLRICVLDPAGRVVRLLSEGSGAREITWDGRDEDGHQVASGPYFIRVCGPDESTTRRVLVLR